MGSAGPGYRMGGEGRADQLKVGETRAAVEAGKL